MRGFEKNCMGRGSQTNGHRDSMKESAKGRFFENYILSILGLDPGYRVQFSPELFVVPSALPSRELPQTRGCKPNFSYISISRRRKTVQCSAVQCSAVQCSAVQCSAVQCSAVQCSAVQCNTVQCTTMQSSLRETAAPWHDDRTKTEAAGSIITTLHCIKLHCTALHCIELHCTALH